MNEALFYTVLPFALAVAVAALLFWSILKLRRDGVPTEIPAHAEVIAGIGVLLATLASITAVVLFALSVGGSFIEKALAVAWLVAFQAVEFTAAFYLARYWYQRNPTMVVLTIGGIALGVISSIFAGQGFLASRIDDLEAERIRQSDAYQAAQAERQAAARQAQSLAISESEAASARADLQRAEAALSAYLASNATNSQGTTVGTVQSVIGRYGCGGYYGRYCGEADRLRDEAAQARAVVERWQDYQGALSHAEALASQPLPSGATTGTLPWIAGIAAFTGLDPATVKANYPFFIAMGGEFIALVFGFIWGANRMQARGGADGAGFAEIHRPHMAAAPAADTGGRLGRDGLLFGHAGEAILNPGAARALDKIAPGLIEKLNAAGLGGAPEAMPTKANAYKGNAYKGNAYEASDKRTVGAHYECEACGAPFQARTVWHRFCAPCGAERRKGVLKAKQAANRKRRKAD